MRNIYVYIYSLNLEFVFSFLCVFSTGFSHLIWFPSVGICKNYATSSFGSQSLTIRKVYKMIYGYIRVSTDKQTTENQRFEIENFCTHKEYTVNSWIEETISGMKRIEERKLGKLLKKMEKDDILVVTELSRLGRNLMQIMSILHFCMERNIMVMTTKEHYELGNNINSEGVILGRPKGRKSSKVKLSGKENLIQTMLDKNFSKSKIARKLRVHRATLTKFIVERLS